LSSDSKPKQPKQREIDTQQMTQMLRVILRDHRRIQKRLGFYGELHIHVSIQENKRCNEIIFNRLAETALSKAL
jgi:hypothetical protein